MFEREARILIVEDDQASMSLLERMLAREGYTDVTGIGDSVEALQECLHRPPDLMLLDLRMPGIDGFEVLARLHPVEDSDWLPVIVLTAERGGEAKRRALSAGAQDYITKPFDREEAMLRIRNLLHTRSLHQRLASTNVALEDVVDRRTTELGAARLEMLERLAAAGEFRDDATGEHASRVGRRSAQLARTLGRPKLEVVLIRYAATLHDIGKIGVPERILLKPGKLSDEELVEMKHHAIRGAELLGGSPSPLLQMAEEIALTHHERWDGGGYPNGLSGEEIPLSGRIVAVADVFDALTQDRPFRDAWALDRAVSKIEAERGHHFDPRVVDAFTNTVGDLIRSIGGRATGRAEPGRGFHGARPMTKHRPATPKARRRGCAIEGQPRHPLPATARRSRANRERHRFRELQVTGSDESQTPRCRIRSISHSPRMLE